MILKLLRQDTSALHAALEQRLPLVDPQLSREGYREILEGFYGYYLPMEDRLSAATVWEEIGFDFVERRKVTRLEIDLGALGKAVGELEQLPRCVELPPLDTIQQVLGCLYVIEGATLGGQVITRHLQANLGITPEKGGGFFAGYGAETGPRWKSFGAMITTAAERFGGENEIIASANRTFETLDLWLFPHASR